MGNVKGYNDWMKFLSNNKSKYDVFCKSSSKQIINDKGRPLYKYRSKVFDIAEVSLREFKQICTDVTMSFNKRIVDLDFQVEEIKRKNASRSRFRNNISNLKIGQPFAIVDIDDAYWFFAHSQGSLNERVYEKWSDEEYKIVRNIAMARTTSVNYKEYYHEGKLQRTVHEVKNLNKILYRNIINACSNYTSGTAILMGEKCLWYTIDSVAVTYEGYEETKNLLASIPDITIKADRCVKINEHQYQSPEGHIKNFY